MPPLADWQKERLALRDQPRQDEFAEVALPPLPAVPGQISDGEARYLYWLANRAYAGAGAVVEVGSWLGRSTVHLAAGLRDAGSTEVVHTFDNYIWRGPADNQKAGLDLAAGDDFLPHFQEFTRELAPWIAAVKADFTEMEWPADRPIEVLFLDAPKTARHFNRCFGVFGPALEPGFSLLCFEDYQHPPAYELPLILHRLGGTLELVHAVQTGGTVSFRLRRPLDPADVAEEALAVGGMDLAQAQTAWTEILAPLTGRARQRVACGQALHLCDLGYLDEARRVLAAVEFDPMLHHMWTKWSLAWWRRPLQRKYGQLFDHYLANLHPEPAALVPRLLVSYRGLEREHDQLLQRLKHLDEFCV